MNTVVFCCKTDKNTHRKEVRCYADHPQDQCIDSNVEHLWYWMGLLIREGEQFQSWWAEDAEGRVVREPSSEIGVYIDERGKIKRKR